MAGASPSLYHLSMFPVRRSLGRSSVSASAYRSGGRMTDLRTGVIADHRRKQHVTPLPLIFPHGSGGISREAFWNGIEAHCRRRDAVVARELDAALPLGLSPDQQLFLVTAFATWISETFKVAVDANLHNKPNNPHIDLLMSANAIGPDGTVGKKVRALDGIASRGSKGASAVERIRAKWAELCNRVLEEAGRPERLDHRSYKRQGIDRVPTIHMGRAAHALELASPGSTEVGRRLGAIKAENERIQREEGHASKERRPRNPRRPRTPKPEHESRARRPRIERQPRAGRRPRRPGVPVDAFMPSTLEALAGPGGPVPGPLDHGRAVRASSVEPGGREMVAGRIRSSETRHHQEAAGGPNLAGLGKVDGRVGTPKSRPRDLAQPRPAKRGCALAAPPSQPDSGGGLAGMSPGHALAGLDAGPNFDLGLEGAGSALQPAGTCPDPRGTSGPRPGGLVGVDEPRAQVHGATSDPVNPSTHGRRAPRASASRHRDNRGAPSGRHRRESGAAPDRVDHPGGGPLRRRVGRRDLALDLEAFDQILKLELASINFEIEHTVELSRRPRVDPHLKGLPKVPKPGNS